MALTLPRGTQDVLPSQSYKWQFLEKLLIDTSALFGFKEMRTPTFEQLDLFLRGVGDTTDVVQKEMFEVKAQKGHDVFALKPEGTAGAVRASIEKGLLNDTLPLKVCYVTPCFRHERPQAGRLREFHQFGCEVFGASNPYCDIEMISMIDHIIKILGLKNIALRLNSIGCKECRAKYYEALRAYFNDKKDQLCPTCHERLEKNPMRVLDCKVPTCAEVAKDAPIMIDYLCDDCKEHFEAVKSGLTALGIEYELDPKIVRGLDYYTRTVFEFVSTDIGAQGTIFGGGRYDGLVEQLGGKPTPAIGFAMGLERLLLLIEAQGIKLPLPKVCDIYIGSIGKAAQQKAFSIVTRLRNDGFFAECDLMDRSVKAQMKYANKIGAKLSMILGDNELETNQASIKDMESGQQTTVDLDDGLDRMLYDMMLASETDKIAKELDAADFLQRFVKGV